MALEKIAELFLEDRRYKSGFNDLQPIGGGVAQIYGQPGYKYIYTHKNDDSLNIKTISYFFFQNDSLYSMKFMAPKHHHFDKYLSDFEKVVASFRLSKNPAN